MLSADAWRSPEVSDPPAVRQALLHRQKALIAEMRRARREPPSAATGCEPLRGPFQGSWGPPAPRYRAAVLGHQVVVEFRFERLPTSPACKPFGISAAVFSGKPATSGYNALGAIAQFQLVGRTGRFLVPLPGGDPPYHVGLYALGIGGMRSNQVVLSLPCNGRCLPPGPPTNGLPEPILAPRGLTRASLARSFAGAVAHPESGFARVTRVSCSSVRACEVSWQDPVEHVRFSERYIVAGERATGCWIAQSRASRGTPPHLHPTVGNPYHLGGCVHWPV